jgi:hypothetical protein
MLTNCGLAATGLMLEISVTNLSLEGIRGCDSIVSLLIVVGERLGCLAAGIWVTLVTKFTGLSIGDDNGALDVKFSLVMVNSLCSEVKELFTTVKAEGEADCGTRSAVGNKDRIEKSSSPNPLRGAGAESEVSCPLGLGGGVLKMSLKLLPCTSKSTGMPESGGLLAVVKGRESIDKLATSGLAAGATVISRVGESVGVTGAVIESVTGLGAFCQLDPLKLCDNRLITKFGWAVTTIGAGTLLLGRTTVFVWGFSPVRSAANPVSGFLMTSGA